MPLSVVSWRSVLLVEETGVPRENHRPVAIHWQSLSYNDVSSTSRHELKVALSTINPTQTSLGQILILGKVIMNDSQWLILQGAIVYKGKNKITELRTILQRESQNSRENHRPVAIHWQSLSYNDVSSTSRHERGLNSQLKWWLHR
jgi:hypothetical protein